MICVSTREKKFKTKGNAHENFENKPDVRKHVANNSIKCLQKLKSWCFWANFGKFQRNSASSRNADNFEKFQRLNLDIDSQKTEKKSKIPGKNWLIWKLFKPPHFASIRFSKFFLRSHSQLLANFFLIYFCVNSKNRGKNKIKNCIINP